jgi:uncharacterized protein
MEQYWFKRDLEKRLNFVPGLPVLIVVGARRVGKTSLLRRYYSALTGSKAWLDGDNPAHSQLWERFRQGQDGKSWLTSLLGNFNQEEVYLFLDEAQMFPDSSLLVKSLVDSLPNVRVVMSGSSALKLRALNSESLAGRKQLLELYTLSLAERLSDSRLPSLAKELSVPAILQDMLVWGGFPGVTQLAESWQRTSYLTDVLDSLIYRDLLSEVRSKDVSLLKRLLIALARSIGGRVNTTKLAGLLELNRATVVRYLDLLQEANLIKLLPGIDKRGIVPKAQPKLYFLDNGFLSLLLADERLFEVRKPEDQAALLENFVVSELVKHYAYRGDIAQLGYLWPQNSEVDIVAYKDGAIQYAWEVKLSRDKAGSSEAKDVLTVPVTVVNLTTLVTETWLR